MLTARAVFRDRDAGRESNRARPTDEPPRGGRRGGFRGQSSYFVHRVADSKLMPNV